VQREITLQREMEGEKTKPVPGAVLGGAALGQPVVTAYGDAGGAALVADLGAVRRRPAAVPGPVRDETVRM
jgi:hypothetical protein